MIFQHTIDKVLSGDQTQKRLLVKPFEVYIETTKGVKGVFLDNIKVSDRPKYIVGKTYAAQPARGKPAVARIRITDIRREDVRGMGREDAITEGFENVYDFWETWTRMHDPLANFAYNDKDAYWIQWRGVKNGGWFHGDFEDVFGYINTRPAERYDAWVITFQLCTE